MKAQIRQALKTVTTAGTRVALASVDTWVLGLRLKAPAANSGVIYIGDVTVAAANVYQMSAGDILPLSDLHGDSSERVYFNLKNMYVDAATNGDKVSLTYYEEVL